GDALPVGDAVVGVVGARVYAIDSQQLTADADRVVVEVATPGTRFVGSLGVDRLLLSTSDPRLDGASGRAILDDVIAVGQTEAKRRIAAERAYFAAAGDNPLVAFYSALAAEADAPPDGSFLIQLAWGAGWSAKTFGEPLTASADWVAIRDEILAARGVGQRGRGPRGRRPNAPGAGPRPRGKGVGQDRIFPFTRRLAEYAGAPVAPFGWARVTLVPVGRALPEPIAPPVPWQVAPLEPPPRDVVPVVAQPVAAGRDAPPTPAPAERRIEPVSPFAQLQALLGQAAAKEDTELAAPAARAPIPPVSDKALKVGAILEAEVVAVEEKRVLVNVGRAEPAAMEAQVLGGGNLTQRYQVGQRLRVKVITAPPFFRIRLA
ncbi:MAG: hypothetical protein NZ518_09195, partial [Dehalococcoidia bacterium]|nr:hypothetical protein [Dehalococcoidia bacterium]